MLTLVNLQNRIEVGIVKFDAVRFHPSSDQKVFSLTDITELVKVVPQFNEEPIADALLQFQFGIDWKIIVGGRIRMFEARDGDGDGIGRRHIRLCIWRESNEECLEYSVLNTQSLKPDGAFSIGVVDEPIPKV